MSRAKITVLSLGGTIAMTQAAPGAGVVPTLDSGALVAAVPGLAEVAEVSAESFRQLPSIHLRLADLEALAARIRELAAQGQHGVVVTQGTDTIEESSFVLDRLLADGDMPVVVTGAMRHPSMPGADGPANLLAACRVAASETARGLGCLVVLNDEIHAARFVRKTHSSRPDAFQSPAAGRLGWLSEDSVQLVVRPPRIPAVAGTPTEAAAQARVALVRVALDDDATVIEALAQAPLAGLVVEGAGGGHVPVAVADALEPLARRWPVVLASRTGAGACLAHTYGYPGGEIDLQRRGLVRAGWLDGLKARVLLSLLLRHGQQAPDAIRAAFRPWSGG